MGILIVDDSPKQRRALASLLEENGYTDLLLAGSITEALQYFWQSESVEVDLILMDLQMPGMSGIDACRYVKMTEERRDIPVIMVTPSSHTTDLKLALDAGALDYIIKPPDEIELVARVQAALKLKREIDQRKARERELRQLNRRLEQVTLDLAEQRKMLRLEQEKSERLLLNILPRPVAGRLVQSSETIAERFEEVTMLFADIVDFTDLFTRSSPEALVELLNEVFSLFDGLAEKYGLEKIKTIGDAYMAVAGLPAPRPDHAEAAAQMALDIQRQIPRVGGGTLKVRVGIHSGPVVAGIIGKKKISYDLWGETVSIASRVESYGLAGCIQVTEETYRRLHGGFVFKENGLLPVKGRGEMKTYLLLDGPV